MTRNDVVRMLGFIAMTYPNVTISDGTPEAWYALLGDLDAEQAMFALRRLLMAQTIPSLPTPGAIRQEAATVADPSLPIPAEAWGEVIKQIRHIGHWGRPNFSHPLIAKAVEIMGWRDICVSEEPDVVRGQFLKIYGTLADRQRKEAVLPEPLRLKSLSAGGADGTSTFMDALGSALRGLPVGQQGRLPQ
jgi:hypothetical protein